MLDLVLYYALSIEGTTSMALSKEVLAGGANLEVK